MQRESGSSLRGGYDKKSLKPAVPAVLPRGVAGLFVSRTWHAQNTYRTDDWYSTISLLNRLLLITWSQASRVPRVSLAHMARRLPVLSNPSDEKNDAQG